MEFTTCFPSAMRTVAGVSGGRRFKQRVRGRSRVQLVRGLECLERRTCCPSPH